jgi:uncharacterized protein YjbI with pentapeptide repeats
MITALKTRRPDFWKIAVSLLLIPIAWIGIAIWKNEEPIHALMPAKNLWDWIQLLLIPLLLAAGVLLWIRFQREAERQRAVLQREISRDGQQESAFQDYINRMTDLLLREKLSKFSPEEVRNAARIRTLTILRGLDPKRKGFVLLFLKDSALVDREAVVDLCGADLSAASLPYARLVRINLGEANLSKSYLCAANLSKAYLSEVNLSRSDLSWANLSGADLFGANLSGADLTRADLSGANLNGANLAGCRLSGANLSEADLTGVNLNVCDLAGANLRGAKLGGAELVGVDLSEADLSQADLSGTRITRTNLEKAKSLEGTTLPDGTKHE